jgi:integrase
MHMAQKKNPGPRGRPKLTGGYTSLTLLRAAAIEASWDILSKSLGVDRSDLEPLIEGTRHTYASQFVMAGGSIEKLQVILGHASVTTTQRYAHLRPDLLRPEDLPALRVELSRAGGDVIDLAAHRPQRKQPLGHGVATDAVDESLGDDVSTHRL